MIATRTQRRPRYSLAMMYACPKPITVSKTTLITANATVTSSA